MSIFSKKVLHTYWLLIFHLWIDWGFPGGSDSKESACNKGDLGLIRKIPWRRAWLPTPIFLPRELHGQKSLVDYSPWGHKESDMTEQLTLALFPQIRFQEAESHRLMESPAPRIIPAPWDCDICRLWELSPLSHPYLSWGHGSEVV